MLGIVIVGHDGLAHEFARTAEHLLGVQERLEVVDVGTGDDLEKRRDELLRAVEAVDTGNGVVIVTDMFGGTPCNLAISVQSNPLIEVVAGLNLPLLVKLLSLRAVMPLKEAVREAIDAGRHYVDTGTRLVEKHAPRH